MDEVSEDPQFLSVETRAKMVNTALLGSLVFAVLLGLYSFLGKNSMISVATWGAVGLIIGAIVGIFAQIPTDSESKFIHLGQVAVKGACYGILVGTALKALNLMSEVYLMRDGFERTLPPLAEVFDGIGGFAFWGVIISLVFLRINKTSETSQEAEKRQKFVKSVFVGFIIFLVCLSGIFALYSLFSPLIGQ